MSASTSVILRSLPVSAERPAKKRHSRFRRILTTVLLVMVATVGLLFGGSLGASGTTPTASASLPFGMCGNPGPGDAPTNMAYWGLGSALGSAVTDAAALGSISIPESNGTTPTLRDRSISSDFTAYQWYGTSGLTWDNFTWESIGGDCHLTASAFGFISNAILMVNNQLMTLTGLLLGWLATVNIVDALFLQPNSLLPNLVETLKNSLFLNYMAPIVMISALLLAWKGLVQKRSREAIQGIVWMFLSSAAALTFLLNPTYFAKTMDDAVYSISSQVITMTASATTQPGSSASKCAVGTAGTVTSARAIDMVTCSLWETFSYTPWVAGQIGPVSQGTGNSGDGTNTKDALVQVVANGSENSATFRGYGDIGMMVLDQKTFNRADVLSGDVFNESKVAALTKVKTAQWSAIADKELHDSTLASGHSLWTGNDQITRIGIAMVALVAQIVAFIPLLLLGFGMLSQQVVFLLLLTTAPIFLTIGINPGGGRKIALGWVEMLLSTVIKRIVSAALIGVLLAFFGAVMASTASSWAVLGWLSRVIILVVGAVAMVVMRGKILKKAGSFVELNGVKASGDKGKAWMNFAGNAIAGGVGAKLAGGNFKDGVKNNVSPNHLKDLGLAAPTSVKALGTFNKERDRLRKRDSEGAPTVDVPESEATGTTATPAATVPVAEPQGIPVPAGSGSPAGNAGGSPQPATDDAGGARAARRTIDAAERAAEASERMADASVKAADASARQARNATAAADASNRQVANAERAADEIRDVARPSRPRRPQPPTDS